MDGIWIELTLVIIGIVANGFFAGSEIALVSARVSRLAQLRTDGMSGAAVAMRLKESPDVFLATIQIAITAVGTLASAVGGATAVEALTPALSGLGFGRLAQPVALAIVIVTITYISLVLGELAPKAIALRNPERIATLVAPTVAALSRGAAHVVGFLTTSTNVVLRVLGLGGVDTSPFVSEEEVRYLVQEGAAKGIFEKVEEQLVHNVFEFGDTIVREIMTPRMAMQGLDIATPPSEVLARVAEIGHSHVPVFDGSAERAVGIITLKSLLRAATRGELPDVRALLRSALFVPELARLSALLREFQRSRQSLAMVVDEYGGVVGLVTVEDVIQEIVGNLPDNDEPAPSWMTPLGDGSWLVDGHAPLDQVERLLEVSLPKSRQYTTVAGLLLDTLQAVPQRGASVVIAGCRWTVVEVDRARIRRVKVDAGR